MNSRIISTALALSLFMTSAPAAYAWQEVPSVQADVLTKESTASTAKPGARAQAEETEYCLPMTAETARAVLDAALAEENVSWQILFLYYPSENANLLQQFKSSANNEKYYVYYLQSAEGDGIVDKLTQLLGHTPTQFPVAVAYNPNPVMDAWGRIPAKCSVKENVQTTGADILSDGISGLRTLKEESGVSSSSPPDAFKNITGTTPTTPGTPVDTSIDVYLEQFGISRQGWEVLRLVNQYRFTDRSGNAKPLFLFKDLQTAAQKRAEELPGLLSHTRPNGTGYETIFRESALGLNIPWDTHAENIASGQPTAADAMYSWLHSSGHRANIERTNKLHIGIGYYYLENDSGYGYKHYWTQNFLANNSNPQCYFSDLTLSKTSIPGTRGAALEDLLTAADIAVTAKCSVHGDCVMPLVAGMCSGYNPDGDGDQTIAVTYNGAYGSSIGGGTVHLTITAGGSTTEHVHSWTETATAATCTEDGERTYTCTGCGETKKEIIVSEGHKFEDGTCSVCKTVLPADLAPVYEEIKATSATGTNEGTESGEVWTCDITKTSQAEMKDEIKAGLGKKIESVLNNNSVSDYDYEIEPIDPNQPVGDEYSYRIKFYQVTGTEPPPESLDETAGMSRAGDDGTTRILVLTTDILTAKLVFRETAAVTYTVTFNANGGTVTPASAVTGTDGKLSSLPTPSRSGYTFSGWYTAASGGSTVSTGHVYTGNTIIYAHWTAVLPPAPAYYTVTFDANGGTVTPASAVTNANRRLSSLPTPTREGYTFDGWFTAKEGGTKVSTADSYYRNTTIYAHWTEEIPDPIVYTITFDATGGEVSPAMGTTGEDGKLSALPTPTRDGYTFHGWYTAADGGDPVDTSYVFNRDTAIYAHWTEDTANPPAPIAYTVTFDPNGGEVADAALTTGADGKLARLPVPTRENYTFDGWYTAADGGSKLDESHVYIGDTTVYAHWTEDAANPPAPIAYTVTFDPNGGEVADAALTTDADGKLARLPVPTRENYTFDGWYTALDGGSPVDTSYVFDRDTTIYAHWTADVVNPPAPVAYTVTFDAAGGEVASATMTTDADGRLDSLPAPTREGYTFHGWYTEGGEEVTADTVFTEDTTLYAHWTEASAVIGDTITVEGPLEQVTVNIPGAKLYMNSVNSSNEYFMTLTLPVGSSRPILDDIVPKVENSGSMVPKVTTNDDGRTWTVTVYHWDGTALGAVLAEYTIRVEMEEEKEANYISIPSVKNGEVIPSARYAERGERVTLSVYPDSGYELDTLSVRDIRGREMALRDMGNSRYSFTMPDTRVTVDASFVNQEEEEAAAAPSVPGTNHTTQRPDGEAFTGLGTPGISGIVLNPTPMTFTDVRPTDWFYSNVDYMWKHYLMSGTSETRFDPNLTTSRAMIWTVLARMNNVRTDINPGSTWYERGMVWAMEQGVTDGSNAMGDITREQLATMLWRNAGSPGAGGGDLSQFSDAGTVSAYARTAVRWAVASGILNGSNGMLNPKGTATRAQVAAMVSRYGDKIA